MLLRSSCLEPLVANLMLLLGIPFVIRRQSKDHLLFEPFSYYIRIIVLLLPEDVGTRGSAHCVGTDFAFLPSHP